MSKVTLLVLLACISLNIVSATNAPATTPATPLPTVKVNAKDGAEIVLIPAGGFLMGTSEDQLAAVLKAYPTMKREWFLDELPQRKVQ